MWREIEKKLLAWKNRSNRKPLVLSGIRQCGKTYSLQSFGREQFSSCVYFNFEAQPGLDSIFAQDFDTERIIRELSGISGTPITEGETLVIFDEVQESPRALTSLKYFCEEKPALHIACAGSLLGTSVRREGFSFPVGKVERLFMFPLTFYEFVQANRGGELLGVLAGMELEREISAVYAERMKDLLRQYFIVGGMPAAVSAWIDSQDLQEVESVQENLLRDYENDFSKHASRSDIPKIHMIWNSIPMQIAKENNKFVFSHVKKGIRAKDLEDALQWLQDAGMIHKNELVAKPEIPLSFGADSTYFKVFLPDVGLLRRRANLAARDIISGNENYKRFKGAFAENYVMTELAAMGFHPYFWRSGNTAEIDFLIEGGGEIIPIEVKAAENVRAKSLALYMSRYRPRCAFKTSLRNVGVTRQGDTELWSLPLFMLWKIGRYLGRNRMKFLLIPKKARKA